MLSKRLQTLASQVETGSIVADIGCDHAYLLVDLAQNGTIKYGYACDINDGPLESAKQNILKYGYEHLLQTRKGSGIQALTSEDYQCVDTLVIAGMGGTLICDILADLERLPHLKRLILQPNVNAEQIREKLSHSQYALTDEILVKDNAIIYPVLVYKKQQESEMMWTLLEKTVGPFILKKKDALHLEYVQQLRAHWEYIIQEMQKSKNLENPKLKTYIELVQSAKEWEGNANK